MGIFLIEKVILMTLFVKIDFDAFSLMKMGSIRNRYDNLYGQKNPLFKQKKS